MLIVAMLGCSDPPPVAPQLDTEAQAACEIFAPIGADIRTGVLEGPELYRKLQDVWNHAQRSNDEAVRTAAQALLTTAIQNDQQATNAAVSELQEACNLPFS